MGARPRRAATTAASATAAELGQTANRVILRPPVSRSRISARTHSSMRFILAPGYLPQDPSELCEIDHIIDIRTILHYCRSSSQKVVLLSQSDPCYARSGSTEFATSSRPMG